MLEARFAFERGNTERRENTVVAEREVVDGRQNIARDIARLGQGPARHLIQIPRPHRHGIGAPPKPFGLP